MMLVGLIWAMFAPLSLLILAGIIDRLIRFGGVSLAVRTRRIAAIGVPIIAVSVLWGLDYHEFQRLCIELGEPKILEKRLVNGIFLDDSTANSFGTRYLYEEGFSWMEARSIYSRDGFTRYEKTSLGITTKEVNELTAEITVESRHSEETPHVSAQRVVIKERLSGRILATAGNAHFNGGRAHWLLGAWGTRSCPSPVTSSGSVAFNRFYHLAKLTLRDVEGGAPPEATRH